jgi:indoleamine 2,3-dioxygenase
MHAEPSSGADSGHSLLHLGFLPDPDPLTAFPPDSELAPLDILGRDLPSLLMDGGFRRYARELHIPEWPDQSPRPEDLPALRLYYLRLGFLASGYVNQVGQEPSRSLPRNIAVPLTKACRLLRRPPILSYDGYALYNWKRFRPQEPIALGNVDTIQNFVHLYDEHWFILVHVEIEAIGSEVLCAIYDAAAAVRRQDDASVNAALQRMEQALRRQVDVLRRIPEKMDPALYYRTFRPYIRFFDSVIYEGVDQDPIDFRGETGAQSSLIPTLLAFLKIPHKASPLMNHLADMRNYMPAEHRAVIAAVEAIPPVREIAGREAFNGVLDALATFREVHYGWAQEYINRWVEDPRGTGGTPYMKWLRQLIDETRAYMKT